MKLLYKNKMDCKFTIALFVIVSTFLSVESFMPSSTRQISTVALNVIPPLDPSLIAAAAGVIGTAAGWGSRSAEVSDLQVQKEKIAKALAIARSASNATQVEYEEKKAGYEAALYEMDTEFEGQTDVIRAEFEKKLEDTKKTLEADYKVKLKKIKSTLEQENNLRLFEQEGRLKQKFLQEKAVFEAEFNSRTADDLVKALEKQSELITENNELKDSLEKVRAELKEIMEIKKGFFG